MAEQSPQDAADEGDAPGVAACETSPGRVVFTDENSSDAWISTDTTVEVER